MWRAPLAAAALAAALAAAGAGTGPGARGGNFAPDGAGLLHRPAASAVPAWGAHEQGTAFAHTHTPGSAPHGSPREVRTQVIRSYPHDPEAFTQGLLLDREVLYESTGLSGRSTSSVRRVDLRTGRVLKSVTLPPGYFGEGLAGVSGRLIQLTWKNEVAFVYDSPSLALRRRLSYEGQGWGLCFDGRSLVMSDGSHRLTYRDPETLAIQRTVDVTMSGVPLRKLNELECVAESVYANVWKTDFIVRIEGATGRVIERSDASGLLTADERRTADVLNGIAYDPRDGTFLITGKLWPRLFRVRFVTAS